MAYATEGALERNFTKWCMDTYEVYAVKGPAHFAKGFPDRFLQLPNGGGTIYVEFKGTSYYGLTKMQEWWRDYIKESSPHRYFLVENPEELEALKEACVILCNIGPSLVPYEKELIEAEKNSRKAKFCAIIKA